MAETSISTNGQVIKFLSEFAREWNRTNRLSPYAGRGLNNIISQKVDKGPTVRHSLVTRLKGAGVRGSDELRGKGEAIGNFTWDTNPTWERNAIEFNKEDIEKTNLALMAEARPLLLQWMKALTRDEQIQAMGAFYDGSTYADMKDATETVKDAWLVTNVLRTHFGAYSSGGSAGGTDHSADLAQIDATNDKFTYTQLRKLRMLAEDADPHIMPYQSNEEGEVYVVFAGSVAHRDFRASLDSINQNADVRGMKITSDGNILARDGDLFFEGTIIRKVPEITGNFTATGKPLALAGAGAAVPVEPVFLCGMQALSHGMGGAPGIVVDREWDFQFRPAVAVEMKQDVKKTFFDSIQHGLITGYFSGAK